MCDERVQASAVDVATWIGRFLLSLAVIAIVSMAVFAAWPQRRTRCGGNLQSCARNLNQIGLAIQMYSMENKGRLPDQLSGLILTQDIDANVFVCPSVDDGRSRGDPPTDQVADRSKPGNCSYGYLGAGLDNTVDARMVLAYELTDCRHAGGMNVLFGDIHVEFLQKDDARRLLDLVAAGVHPVIWSPAAASHGS